MLLIDLYFQGIKNEWLIYIIYLQMFSVFLFNEAQNVMQHISWSYIAVSAYAQTLLWKYLLQRVAFT